MLTDNKSSNLSGGGGGGGSSSSNNSSKAKVIGFYLRYVLFDFLDSILNQVFELQMLCISIQDHYYNISSSIECYYSKTML